MESFSRLESFRFKGLKRDIETFVFLGFSFISVPFLFFSTNQTVYSNKISFSVIPILGVIGLPILDFKLFFVFSLACSLSLVFYAFNRNKAVLAMGMISYFIIASHYVSFLMFEGNYFANGTVLPLWYFAICLIQQTSNKAAQFWRNAKYYLIGFCFLAAGISKILNTGIQWANSENFSQLMFFRHLLSGGDLSYFIGSSVLVSWVFAIFALLFELVGWTLLIANKRMIFGAIAVVFISFTYFVMDISEFFYLYLPLYMIFFGKRNEDEK